MKYNNYSVLQKLRVIISILIILVPLSGCTGGGKPVSSTMPTPAVSQVSSLPAVTPVPSDSPDGIPSSTAASGGELLIQSSDLPNENNELMGAMAEKYDSEFLELHLEPASKSEVMKFRKKFEEWKESRHKEFEKKLNRLSKEISANPESSELYCKRGDLFRNNKQFERARADYTRAIEKNPKNFDAWNRRGCAAIDAGKIKAAMKDLSEARKVNPKNYKSYLNMGFCYDNLHQPDRAIIEFNKAKSLMKAKKDEWYYYTGMGNVYFARNDLKKSLEYLMKAVECNDKDYSVYETLAFVYSKMRDYKQIKKYADLLIGEIPFGPEGYYYLGHYYLETGKYYLAGLNLDKSLIIDPHYSIAWMDKGLVKLKMNRRMDALSIFNYMLQFKKRLHPDIIPANILHYYRGVSYASSGFPGMGMKDLKEAINLDKNGSIAKLAEREIKRTNRVMKANKSQNPGPSTFGYFDISKEEMDKLSNEFFTAFKDKKYEQTAEMFHYPEYFSLSEKAVEILDMTRYFKQIESEMGKISSYKTSQEAKIYYVIRLICGDPYYWARYPVNTKWQLYEVNFTKIGRGYVALSFIKIKGRIEIRQIIFGLPPSQQKKAKSLEKIMAEIQAEEAVKLYNFSN